MMIMQFAPGNGHFSFLPRAWRWRLRSPPTSRASGRVRPAKPPAGDAAEVVKALDESWPDHPEWVDMLVGDP